MEEFHVVVPSRNALNLARFLDALFVNEPDLPMEHVVVVDDGGASGAEGFSGVKIVKGIVPFVFSRNVNVGISAAGGDVIVMNDDALLVTGNGLSRMAGAMAEAPTYGYCSAAVLGRGHREQFPLYGSGLRAMSASPNFCCVHIPRRTLDLVGTLDERFVAYGHDDSDFCKRVRDTGLLVGVFDRCVVSHEDGPAAEATYIRVDGFCDLVDQGREIYRTKWG